jgi:adenylate kinase family enzyme
MKKRIHIFGASGTGTTTLAKAVAEAYGIPHFDTDEYFWHKTDPPFQVIREKTERKELLRVDLCNLNSWVLSGSLCGWGDFAIPMFDHVVFLWLPSDIRMHRLMLRELERYGPDIVNPGSSRYQHHTAFLEWAAAYDSGSLDMQSRASHERWISTLPYSVIRIEGDTTVQERLQRMRDEVSPLR